MSVRNDPMADLAAPTAQVGITPERIQQLDDFSHEEEERLRRETSCAGRLRAQFQTPSDRDLSVQQVVLLFAQQESLRLEDVIDYGLRTSSPSKRFAILSAILTRLHIAIRSLQSYLSELAKETRLRVTLNQIYVVDPTGSLYEILRGASSVVILATAWSVLANRLAHGLDLSEKYYKEAIHVQVSSPASTMANVYDLLPRDSIPESALREHFLKLPSVRRTIESCSPGQSDEQISTLPLAQLAGVDEGVLRAFPSPPPSTPYTYDDNGNKSTLAYFDCTSVNASTDWKPPEPSSSGKGKQKSVAFDVASESSAYTHDAPIPSPEVIYHAAPVDYLSYYTALLTPTAVPSTPYKSAENLFTPNPSAQ
ncbi:hypothetical protein EIP86_010946, partial [Pleurotus ostreatoroseus]